VSDEALRALAREARARPDDADALRAHVRALERAGGGRRELHLALCMLARAGDAEGARRVARWSGPGSSGEEPPLPDLTRARSRVVQVQGLRGGQALGVWEGRAFVATARELLAIDLETGQTVWSRPCGGQAVLRGDRNGADVTLPGTRSPRRAALR
jgi:hypothetical protein